MAELSLLILQPTPFCNIDCKYCYLPQRGDTTRITDDTLEAIFRNVFRSQCVGKELAIIWHAGEPLVVGIGFYKRAIELARRHCPPGVELRQAMQTNAILINREWCQFFKEYNISVGVSVDGPKAIHDVNRVFRNKTGTFDKVLAGIKALQQEEVPFHVISVVGSHNIDKPDEMFDFFDEHDIVEVSFNVEESDGIRTSEVFEQADIATRFKAFIARFVERVDQSEKSWSVRELDSATASIFRPKEAVFRNPQVEPFGIVTVAHNGDFTTFSPEFLGTKDAARGDFIIGNLKDGPIELAESNPVFKLLKKEISAGVAKCKRECQYFSVCGGGAPANKHAELGTMNATSTKYCECVVKATTDLVMERFETQVFA